MVMMGAEDINFRMEGLGLDFRLERGTGGHWILYHAGYLALFLGLDEQEAARDCRFFLCGITHSARHWHRRPDDVQALRDRLEQLSGLPAEDQVDMPGWIVR